MSDRHRSDIGQAELVLPCVEFDATLEYFADELGFRLEMVHPADAPRVAVVSGYGVRLRLESASEPGPVRLRLITDDPVRPGVAETAGMPIEFAPAAPPLSLPPLEEALIVQRAGDDAHWGAGRAGMQYRDLIPGRLGGRFIASHIRIPDGGPVPDYVHHHHVRFQMIYCYRGWVRVVYEDQGPPFVMHAGDCVLQPPHIRHRVLECSDAFEVVELGCPAEHETLVEHDIDLPNPGLDRDRTFDGQRFVFHRAAAADWRSWRSAGFEVRDTGIGAATGGLAGVTVIRRSGPAPTLREHHDAELLFRFVLEGRVRLSSEGGVDCELAAGDAFVVPAGMRYALSDPSDDLALLEVALPADATTIADAGNAAG